MTEQAYKRTDEQRERMSLAAKERWARRKAREAEEAKTSSTVPEEALEAYHKSNYTKPLLVRQEQQGQGQGLEKVTLNFSISAAIHETIIKEADMEGRSVPAHIAWLIKCLYDPPAMTSCSRAHDMAMRRARDER